MTGDVLGMGVHVQVYGRECTCVGVQGVCVGLGVQGGSGSVGMGVQGVHHCRWIMVMHSECRCMGVLSWAKQLVTFHSQGQEYHRW